MKYEIRTRKNDKLTFKDLKAGDIFSLVVHQSVVLIKMNPINTDYANAMYLMGTTCRIDPNSQVIKMEPVNPIIFQPCEN